MSERFIKFIPSKKSIEFAIKHKNAFILLLIIAEQARRTNSDSDGLKIGQCHLGNHKNYGMTEKEYRYAKKILIQNGLIKIILTNRTRTKKKTIFPLKFGASTGATGGATERATGGATEITTTGTLVELCNSEVWDINSEEANQQKGDRKGDSKASVGPEKGRQTRMLKKEKKEKDVLPQPPSFPIPQKIKFREKIDLTQDEYDKLLALHGKELLDCMLNMLNSYKGRKGAEYKEDYYAMDKGSWVLREAKKELENQKTPNEKPFRTYQPTPPGNTPGSQTKFEPGRVLRGSNPAEELQPVLHE